jgi:hypothetical protein
VDSAEDEVDKISIRGHIYLRLAPLFHKMIECPYAGRSRAQQGDTGNTGGGDLPTVQKPYSTYLNDRTEEDYQKLTILRRIQFSVQNFEIS